MCQSLGRSGEGSTAGIPGPLCQGEVGWDDDGMGCEDLDTADNPTCPPPIQVLKHGVSATIYSKRENAESRWPEEAVVVEWWKMGIKILVDGCGWWGTSMSACRCPNLRCRCRPNPFQNPRYQWSNGQHRQLTRRLRHDTRHGLGGFHGIQTSILSVWSVVPNRGLWCKMSPGQQVRGDLTAALQRPRCN